MMSPEDEYAYWAAPIVNYIAVPNGPNATRLCQRNPRRTLLIIGMASSPSGGMASVAPDPNVGSGALQGVSLQVGQAPLVLTQKDHGPAAQDEWWGSSVGTQPTVTVIEYVLTRWPREQEDDYEGE